MWDIIIAILGTRAAEMHAREHVHFQRTTSALAESVYSVGAIDNYTRGGMLVE